MIDFVRNLIAMQSAFPILRCNRFLIGEYNPDLDVNDVRWLTPEATDMADENWSDPTRAAWACCWTRQALRQVAEAPATVPVPEPAAAPEEEPAAAEASE